MAEFPRLYCPICANNDLSRFTLHKGMDDKPFAAVCDVCRLCLECKLTADPINVYRESNYDKTRNKGEGGSRWSRFHHDCAVAKDRIKQVERVLSDGKTLSDFQSWQDVGCSNGAVGVALRSSAPHLSFCGFEADPETAKQASALTGLTIAPYSDWPLHAQAKPVISFYDVLEHVLNPVSMLEKAISRCVYTRLGLIVIECPDYGEVANSTSKFYSWKHRRVSDDVTEHLWHFSQPSLEYLRERLQSHASPATVKAVSYSRHIPGRLQAVWLVE